MKLEELTKIVIKELEYDISKNKNSDFGGKFLAIKESEKSDIDNNTDNNNNVYNKRNKNDEIEFLNALKERIIVLFEGLNTFDDNIEARLELNIKFLEFLLATIYKRLRDLSE